MRDGLLDSSKLVRVIEEITANFLNRTRNQQASKTAIDASFAGGPPKTIEAGASGTYEHSVSPSYFWGFPTPSESAVKQPLGDGEVLTGSLYDIPAGVVYNTGAYKLLPVDRPEAATTVANTGTTTVKGMKILIAAPILVAKVVFEVVGATASALAAIGIYSSDRGNLLINTGAIDCSSNGVKEVTLGATVQLQPGWYWVMFTVNDTSTTLRAVAIGTSVTNVLNQGTVQHGNAANTASAAVLPATLGTITGASFSMPIVKLQA